MELVLCRQRRHASSYHGAIPGQQGHPPCCPQVIPSSPHLANRGQTLWDDQEGGCLM